MIIAVECYTDEKLVLMLLPESKDLIRHMYGRGNVINRLRKEITDRAVGLIDEDPRSAHSRDFINNYIETESIGAIKRFQHKEKAVCSIVMLCPRIEEWFIYKAKSIGIQLADFKLPEDGEVLHSIIHYERNENFNEFLTKLLTSDDEEINKLRKWLMGDN